jgi:hypothetical protein
VRKGRTFGFCRSNGFVGSFRHTRSKIIDCKMNRIFVKDTRPVTVRESVIKQQIIPLNKTTPTCQESRLTIEG